MEEILRILILEDVIEDALLVERVLRNGEIRFISMRVDAREEYIRALHSFQPDVILSDHALPQFNSLEAMKIYHSEGLQCPFILVTGAVSEEFAVSCLKLGADDYILKSNLSRLPSALLGAMKKHHMESRKKEAEQTLRTQNEKLIKVNNELDNFVYSVSHNLRAPLTSVLGLLNLVRAEDRKQNNVFEEYFAMMEHSVRNLDTTLKEILDYSRNNRVRVVPVVVDIEQLILDCFEGLKYLDGDKVSRKIIISGDSVVVTDADRLSIILTNILSNAVRYRDIRKETAEITVYVSISTESFTVHCQDNGIGINEEYLPRIFDMFYRASERSDGAGLGLYIVKETVEKLDGTVYVGSSPDEGTTVIVTLPNMTLERIII